MNAVLIFSIMPVISARYFLYTDALNIGIFADWKGLRGTFIIIALKHGDFDCSIVFPRVVNWVVILSLEPYKATSPFSSHLSLDK
jgi:hypothetical protein